MPTRPRPKLNLRIFLLAFAAIAAIATLANSFWVMYSTQKQDLIDNALEGNKAYASRIATAVDQVLSSDLDRLRYSSTIIGKAFGDQRNLADEAHRLLGQDHSFNSVLITDAQGVIIASEPRHLHLDGQSLQDKTPIQRREPIISNAFRSLAGNLVVFISQPVFDPDGKYLGLVGGSIRLEQHNTLRALMDLNVRQDGAYVYLVDARRQVLYHADPEQIGTIVQHDPIVEAALSQGAGALPTADASAERMLAGFASIPSAHWAIVSQQPLAYIQATLQASAIKVAKGIIPLGVFGLVLIWWLGVKISIPLSRLAESAKRLDAPESYERIGSIPTDYVESWQIRRALLLGAALLQEKIGRLNHEAQSDALTGLANRRAMQQTLTLWQQRQEDFAVVSIDIDHFKRVNDTFGHGVGDETLRAVAGLIRQSARPNDLLCRTGGEEFVLLLPNGSLRSAADVAERLRAVLDNTPLETVGHITISLGVALWRPGSCVETVLERADQLLYLAKQRGRNRVEVEETVA